MQAVVMGNQLRLMLQKPTPQESLLHNGDFRKRKVVNQKTQDSYKVNGYTIDRFIFYSDIGKHTLTITDDGIVLSSGGTNNPWIRQISEDTFTIGNMYTYTVQAKASVAGNAIGLKVSNADNYDQGIIKWFEGTTDFQNFSYTFNMPYKHAAFELIGSINGDITAARLKLEPGNRFTGWPAWDYGAELLKCQRYLLGIRPDNYKEGIIPIGQGVATTNGKVRFLIPTPVPMRTRPVLNVNINNLRVVSTTPDVANGIIPQTVNNMFYSNSLIFIDVYAQGLTAGNAYELYLYGTTTDTMLFSAEL